MTGAVASERVSEAQLFPDRRVFVINKAGKVKIFLFFPIAFVTGKDDDVLGEAVSDSPSDRDSVAYASVDHRYPVYIRNWTEDR